MTQTLTTERLREIAERRSPSLRWGEAEKIAAECLANREAQPVGYTSEAALDLLSHGQSALIHKDAETTTFIEEEYRDVIPLFTYAPAVASGENCWSCGKFFTYEQHSECDGYCPYCDAPVDLDKGEEGAAPPAPVDSGVNAQSELVAIVERLNASGYEVNGEGIDFTTASEAVGIVLQQLHEAVESLSAAPPAPAVPTCFSDAIDDMENVMAWILRLPVPTEGATAKAGRLKNSIDACRAAMLNNG